MGKYSKYEGNHVEKLRYMKRTTTAIYNNNNYYYLYVGATSKEEKRLERYEEDDLKHIIYETNSKKVAETVEEELIRHVKEVKRFENCNQSPYSIGLKDGEEIYLVYVIGSKVCQTK